MRLPVILAAAALMFQCGCASVEVKRIAYSDTKTEGVRYYGSQPYLLVGVQPAADGKGAPTFQTQIVYLPKWNEVYSVKVKPGWGTANGSVKLNPGGTLAEFGTIVDSKMPETISAISGLVTAAAGAANPKMVGVAEDTLPPGLYRIIISSQTGEVTGLERVTIK